MKKTQSRIPFMPRASLMALVLALGGAIGLAGCTMTPNNAPPPASAATFSSRSQLDAAARETLNRLYRVVPGSRDMVSHAAGVLVFPQVIGGALFVGAEHGRGALLVGGRVVAYYSTTGASIGWQIGGQSKSVVYVFNTRDALKRFQDSNGWTVGADATVAVGTVGANGSIDSQTAQQPIVSFVMNNVGLEAGLSLGGSKITRIEP